MNDYPPPPAFFDHPWIAGLIAACAVILVLVVLASVFSRMLAELEEGDCTCRRLRIRSQDNTVWHMKVYHDFHCPLRSPNPLA